MTRKKNKNEKVPPGGAHVVGFGTQPSDYEVVGESKKEAHSDLAIRSCPSCEALGLVFVETPVRSAMLVGGEGVRITIECPSDDCNWTSPATMRAQKISKDTKDA